ncbi:unnamed protein product [Mytilus coruscus]|uniref:LRRNT domain-containing protein n=1 Tax=Mytilus coruscus TaxID=42192 RepID=A0A6J8EQ18_MYTCO|nr:unnamed protein product [Mytilus coruscus]
MCDCSGTTINCANQNLTHVPSNIPANTTVLRLNGNQIQIIDATSLSGLTSLLVLDLSKNKLSNIEDGALSDLESLFKLNLFDNKLSSFKPDTFTGLGSLIEFERRNGSLYEEEKLQELLRMFFKKYAGHPTLYIIDDCSATKELTKKKDMLSELAFSGRHAEQSVWVISQRYNSVLKDLREQTKWLCMFYTKDRDSFDNCLRENDVIPTLEERQRIKEELKKKNIVN